MDWINLAQDRDQWSALVNTVLNIPLNAGKFLNSYIIGGFLRRAQLHEVTLVSLVIDKTIWLQSELVAFQFHGHV
jgi:hypothetical protein